MGSVLVHIDLDGDRPHPSSLSALTAGRATASSWGATLYAAVIIHDPTTKIASSDVTARLGAMPLPRLEAIRAALARAGADKVLVAVADAPVAPLWAAVGGAWQGVLDHLRPRLVLFGADAPSAPELGPRTAARIGARLLARARAIGIDHVELRERDGAYVRASDGGAAVVLVGAMAPLPPADDDIDIIVLQLPDSADARVELAGTSPAELVHTAGALVVIDDAIAADPEAVEAAHRLATLLGAQLVGGPGAVRAGTLPIGASVERTTPLAPELCVAIGAPALDLAGATSLVRIGTTSGKHVDGALPGPAGPALAELVRALDPDRKDPP